MKKRISFMADHCDSCGKNLFLSNHQSVHMSKKKTYTFCNDTCENKFAKKKRWKGYPIIPFHLR